MMFYRKQQIRQTVGFLAGMLLGISSVAMAGGTKIHHLSDFEDFDRGDVKGAAIESSGRVTVGFTTDRTELQAISAYSCTAHPSAKQTIAYVGTADPASIQRVVRAKNTSADRIIVEKVAELPGIVVTAMVPLENGELIAATLPGGTLYRVDKQGKVHKFATLDVEQIWALKVHQKRLLVATGPHGQLFSLDLTGKDAKVLFDSEEKHVLSVLTVQDKILVGTAPRAKLYQVANQLEGILLHDFEGDELRSLASTSEGLFAAVNEFSAPSMGRLESLKKELNRTSLVGQPAQGNHEEDLEDDSLDAQAKLYHVHLGKSPDPTRAGEAAWELWLEKKNQYFTAISTISGSNTVLVASGNKGKVYRINGRRDIATVSDLEERQATDLCNLGQNGWLITAGDGAAVYHLTTQHQQKAKYRSEVFDAGQPASYGAIHLRGHGPLGLRVRSGPAEEPDSRWDEWQEIQLSRQSDFFLGRLDKIRPRRYLQFEIQLASPASELRALKLFYAPENIPPLLQSIEIVQPDFDSDDEKEPDSKIKIEWKVDAQDEDKLIYSVQVRPEGTGEKQWIKLGKEPFVTEKELEWDIDSIPDGTYEVGITASDEPANGSFRAKKDELVSAPFTIDRKRPSIGEIRVNGLEIRGVARDEGSYIHDVSYSINEGPFHAASPTDGLFDSASEEFILNLPNELGKGRHRLMLRARDAFGSLASKAVIVEL